MKQNGMKWVALLTLQLKFVGTQIDWLSEWFKSGWMWVSEWVHGWWVSGCDWLIDWFNELSAWEWVDVGWWVNGWVGEWVNVIDWLIEWVSEWVRASTWVDVGECVDVIDWLIDWVNEWMGEWMSVWEWVDVGCWVNEWVGGCGWVRVSECDWLIDWMSEWVSEWMSEWVDQTINQSLGTVARLEASSLGMQAAPSSIPMSGTFFCGDLVMKTFLRPFSLFLWFKKSRCQLLAKECALSTGKLPMRLAQEQYG